jgi:hypothetical protein
MTKTFLLFLAVMLFLSSCQSQPRLKVSDVVVTDRLFSPDSAYVALTYYVDNGAMGQSLPRTSLMKVEDTLGVLNDYWLPCFDLPLHACYYPDKWLDNKTLQVFLNERPFVRTGVAFPAADTVQQGIHLKVVLADYSYEHSPLIEHFSFSPNRQKLMVAYRYRGVSELNISVIDYHDTLPRIGNIFTNAEISWNPIVFGKWSGEGIDLLLRNAAEYKLQDYLNQGIKLPVRFVDVEDAGYSGDRQCWLNSKLYVDSTVDKLLDDKGKETKARIVEAIWQMDENDRSLFYYEYEYTVKGRTYRSYFRIFKPFRQGQDYEKGDILAVMYDPAQPLIHRTKQNYSR